MATYTVTTNLDVVDPDNGRLSLREAVAQANATAAADTINFAPNLEGQKLTLTRGELLLSHDTTIDGDQNNDGREVTLSGGGASRILHITGGDTDMTLRDLGLTHGAAPANENGGAILLEGRSVKLSGCAIFDSYAYGGGGIFAAQGDLTLNDCTIRDCRTAGGDGGAIFAVDGTTTLTNSRLTGNHAGRYGGAAWVVGSVLEVTGTMIGNNQARVNAFPEGQYGHGGGLALRFTAATVSDSSIYENNSKYGGGIFADGGSLSLANSTIAANRPAEFFGAAGGGILAYNSQLIIRGTTITGNSVDAGLYYSAYGGGIAGSEPDIANSIVAGNFGYGGVASDIASGIARSNGHNIFGSDVDGAIIGDLQGVAPGLLFASLDPDTGGGQVNAAGIVPLRNSVTNPALSGGDPLAAMPTDQIGTARPLPTGSLPDLGAAERNQTAVSTTPSANNDTLTGTDGANTILGKAGADLIRGLGGNDTLRGEAGSDLLDGGSGNDLLDGGDGIDLARFGGSTAVTVDLVAGTARRGSESDALSSIQGAIGSSAADTFKGDGGPNWFQGGGGRDVATGGAARDLYDFDRIQDSLPGSANRDVITDFAPGSDKIDLTGIDADAPVAGNQAFTWVDGNALTGAGQLGFFTSGADTTVRASIDADATAEFQIQLTGLRTLTVDDFYM